MKRIVSTIIITLIFLSATAAEQFDRSMFDTLRSDRYRESVLDIRGADITIYDLMCDNIGKNDATVIEYAEIFLKSIDLTKPDSSIARLELILAEYYEKEVFQFSKAIQWRHQLLESYRESGEEKEAAENMIALGRLYFKTEQFDKTLTYSLEAEKIFEKHKDTLNLLACYNLLGIVYRMCGDDEKSDRYFMEFSKDARESNDSASLIMSLNNAALTLFQKDSVKGRRLISESIEICRQYKDSSLLNALYMNISTSYASAGQYDKAEQYLGKSLPLLKTLEEYGQYYYILSNIQFKRGELDKAEHSAKKAIDYYSHGEFKSMLKYCHAVLQEIYAGNGEYDKAYEALLKVYELEVASFDNNVYLKLYKTEEMIRNKEVEERTKINRILYFSLGTIFFVIIVAGITIALLYQKKKFTENILKEKELEKKEKNVELRNIHQYQMSRMIEKMLDELHKINDTITDTSTKNKILQMCHKISTYTDDENWKELNNYIPEFNSTFTKNLSEAFPSLTINEKRLCVFLLHNMSTKDISEITGQSPNSINVARARLRNKLGIIGIDTSIQEFLNKYQ